MDSRLRVDGNTCIYPNFELAEDRGRSPESGLDSLRNFMTETHGGC